MSFFNSKSLKLLLAKILVIFFVLDFILDKMVFLSNVALPLKLSFLFGQMR